MRRTMFSLRSRLLTLFAAGAVAIAAQFTVPSAWAEKVPVIAVDQSVATLDPYDANDTLSQAVAKSFYEGLFGFDKDMKLVNVLATSYTVSKDGLVYTVKLRPGVKFHDGTDFNAAAVKANFDRVTNPANKLKRYGLYSEIAKTEAVDPHTVRFTLKKPFSPFINTLAHPSGVMISPAALQKYGKDIAFHPVGTGPFQFVEWKQPDYVRGKKFAGYWKKGYPKVDGIFWKSVLDNNTRTLPWAARGLYEGAACGGAAARGYARHGRACKVSVDVSRRGCSVAARRRSCRKRCEHGRCKAAA